jgi:tetratricopeptide (TPR) repeat protein
MRPGRILIAIAAMAASAIAQASWYWPFGSDDGGSKKDQPRLSELMEQASISIDTASDLAAEGKVEEAVAEYRKALVELDRVERENPERAATPEFATVRNKRAIVNASIDSLYLAQARENAKAVAVTDTTELEKRFAERRAERLAAAEGETKPKAAADSPKLESQLETYMAEERERNKTVAQEAARSKTERAIQALLAKDPNSRKARVMQAGEMLRAGDTDGAAEKLDGVLAENPNDISALNMRAVCEVTQGRMADAKATLTHAIKVNPNDYHAYYNMARLVMQTTGKKSAAKRYYETGRTVGGPEDKGMEALFE